MGAMLFQLVSEVFGPLYGSRKCRCELNSLRRWADRPLGQVHVPGRLRSCYIMQKPVLPAGRFDGCEYDSEFDLIVNGDALEHTDAGLPVTRNFCRALRPGGCVIVSSPSIRQRKHLSLLRWRERRSGFHPSRCGHLRDRYSERDLEEKCCPAGERVVRACYKFGFFGTLAFDLFSTIGDSRPNAVAFGLTFAWLVVRA